MHSEWAANMEQTTSMTHETALHNWQSTIVERCALTDKTRAILKDDVATRPNKPHGIYRNKLISEEMTEYLGGNVSAELHVKPRKALAQPHAEPIKVCWWRSIKEESWRAGKVGGWGIR